MKGLHIFGVSHAYGNNRVLDNVGLLVPAGDLVCLLGPSGCGKSTLLRLAAGLERLQTGSIVIDDETVAAPDMHMPPEDRRIGLMFQDFALFPHLTVLENVTFGLNAMAASKAETRAMEMLDQVGMTRHAASHPHMLSGGQQQRIALARALAPEPKLLLLDEPFSGLDTDMRARLREETLGVLKASGVATLMVTHDPEEAMFMADRIKIMGESGSILQAGRPHEIYYHPKHEFVAKLFGLMNRFDGRVKDERVETPLGPVHAPDMPDGLAVQALIRPEGVILKSSEDAKGTPVEVIATHLLGHDNIVRVRVGGDGSSGQELYVRVHHTFEPELAPGINAVIDSEYAFVFPANEPGKKYSLAPPGESEAAKEKAPPPGSAAAE